MHVPSGHVAIAGFASLARDVDAAGARLARPRGLRLRAALLSTAAAGALSLAIGGPALGLPAGCTIDATGTIETCIGDQTAGVSIVGPTTLTTLDVNNLTTAIAPASGTDGINFVSSGAVTITSSTGTFGITTAGNNTLGILASSTGGAVAVTSTGNITTAGSQAYG